MGGAHRTTRSTRVNIFLNIKPLLICIYIYCQLTIIICMHSLLWLTIVGWVVREQHHPDSAALRSQCSCTRTRPHTKQHIQNRLNFFKKHSKIAGRNGFGRSIPHNVFPNRTRDQLYGILSMIRSERRLLWVALYEFDVDDVLQNLTESNWTLAEGLGCAFPTETRSHTPFKTLDYVIRKTREELSTYRDILEISNRI